MSKQLHLSLSAVLTLAIVCGFISVISVSASPAFAQKSNQLPPRRTRRIKPVAEGPYKEERSSVRNWLMQAKKRGVGIKGYLAVYNDMETAVKNGQPDNVVKEKLDRIHQSIGDQYESSRKLQAPGRKLSKQRSPYVDHKRGKRDLIFGNERYNTPHEVRRTCEEAERQAIRRLPPEWRGNLAVLQDLRNQRDEREYALNRRFRFKDRGFTKNPNRYKNVDGFSRGGGTRSYNY